MDESSPVGYPCEGKCNYSYIQGRLTISRHTSLLADKKLTILILWISLKLWVVDVGAAVTSLSVVGMEVIVGTVASDIYQIRLSFEPRNPSKPERSGLEFHGKTKNLKNKSKSLYDNKKAQRKLGSGLINEDQHNLQLDSATPELELLATCHSEPICDVTFPR